MKSTTIRISAETKKKMEVLKKGLSHDKYINRLNEYVEKENVDIEVSADNIPKLIKDRSSAIIKILRAFEKQYLTPIKSFSENSLELNLENNIAFKNAKTDLIEEIKTEKEEIKTIEKIVNQVDEQKKDELLNLIKEVKEKGEEMSLKNADKVVYNPFFLYQKIDLILQKIERL